MGYRLRAMRWARGALYRGTWVIETYWHRWQWGRTRRDTFDWHFGPFRFLKGSDRSEPGRPCGERAGGNTLLMWKWVEESS